MVDKIRKFILKFLGLWEEPVDEIIDEVNEAEEIDEDRFTKSFLNKEKAYITDGIYVRIPTVGEILKDEESYYGLTSALSATPIQYAVQLDDMGLDYTEVTEYELFLMLFMSNKKNDLSIIFGDLDLTDYEMYTNHSNNTVLLHSNQNGESYDIDEYVYSQIADTIRMINNFEKNVQKPGNDFAKKHLVEQERKKMKRKSRKKYEPYLEKLVIALVNRPEFKYNYEETMNMSIYKFNQSFKQIQTSINFDKTMIGVYAGTVDTSKLKDRTCLSWIPIKQ